MKKLCLLLLVCSLASLSISAQNRRKTTEAAPPQTAVISTVNDSLFENLKWRNIGPFRGGRSNAVAGVPGNDQLYYMGTVGGGLWKTTDAGTTWENISDGHFKTGSVGAIAVAPSDHNVIYAGMGEHAVRGVMTSHGDGVYKSTDAGKTWKNIGLPNSKHIAAIRVHPQNPDVLLVAVQGALHGPSADRGVYHSSNGGMSWTKVLYVDENTGACDLSMDPTNPRILYAGMWDHRRLPWVVRSGGPGSGMYKSTDGGLTWKKLSKGLPKTMGKIAVDVSPANPDRVYANIEAEKGGVFRSDDGGESWIQTSSDRATITRAWYYIEIFADPVNPDIVYVLNAPMMRSIDGGRTFQRIANPHGDQHHLWINPDNNQNMILANDGGACVTFNGGQSWSSQQNQPTAQFYRVIADERFPYYLYAGQQDNTTVCIPSRGMRGGVTWQDWYPVAGGESAFLAFDPKDPRFVFGGSYQGNISVYDHKTQISKDIMAYPVIGLAEVPKEMKYRFNWNAPIVASPQNPDIIYHGGNVVFQTKDRGQSWNVISADLTRNDTTKQGRGGEPFTNEGAGGENYNTLSYIACSPHQYGVLYTGSDCGLVHITKDDGKTWQNVTPPGAGEAIINSIEVSPHNPAAAYVAVTRYKFNDFTPLLYYTSDYGQSWTAITKGFAEQDFVRVVREDTKVAGMLYAGTETGLYLSIDNGKNWQRFQGNLPVCPVLDLYIRDNDLIAATSGRAFWILDDLGALQQSKGMPGARAQVFQPKPTVRIDIPSARGAVPGLGQNPLSGVIIDYYLPSKIDSGTVMLEVMDQKGTVLRSFSNQPEKGFQRYEGGPSPKTTISADKGVNRFNWDMRTESIPGIPGVFVNGDYRGHTVAPGTYRLRLSTPKDTSETSFQLLPDPRLSATPAEYLAQQEILQDITDKVKDIHQSVNRMRAVKQQVESLQKATESLDQAKELREKGKDILKKIDQWERELISPDQKTFQDVINFKNKLNAELLDLKDRIDMHDPAPTKGARERLSDLSKEWNTQKQALENLINGDIADYNKQYRESNLPALVVPETPPTGVQ